MPDQRIRLPVGGETWLGSPHWLAACFLAVLAAGQIHLRARHSVCLPRFQSEDETAYFRAESAAQYRYARMVASGAGVPEIDREAQYPEGIRTRQELTTLMEHATGWTFRALNLFVPIRDFRWFVILWTAAAASLALPALYVLCWRISRSMPLALAATAAFALSWAAMANGIGTYGLESFALPLLLSNLALLACALDPDVRAGRLHAFLSGALLALALGSWHFSRFHLAALWLALAWTAWRWRKHPPAMARVRYCTMCLVLFSLAAGLAFPHLRHTAFLGSPVMLPGYGLLLALIVPRRALAISLAAMAAMCFATGPGESAAYGHVYGLLWDKLRLGLQRPSDPSLLSGQARLLWAGPFQSPEPGFALFSFLPLALVGLPRLASLCLAARGQETRGHPAGTLTDALLIAYLAGTMLVARLMPMLAFLLCAAAVSLPRHWLKTAGMTAAFLVVAGLEGAKSLAPASRLNPFMKLAAAWSKPDPRPALAFANERALIGWLARNAPGQPVLANYGLSPSLLTYAGTPVLLQPKFEAPGIRAKVARYLHALYSSEEDFLAFCREYGAVFFVYSSEDILDESPDGPRYASGEKRLEPDTAAVLFHFHPESLRHFRLVYENPDFRVYKVGERNSTLLAGRPDSIYDIDLFSPRTLSDGSLSLDAASVNARIQESRQSLFLARVLARLGQGERALSAYEASFAIWPPDDDTRAEARRLRSAIEHGQPQGRD